MKKWAARLFKTAIVLCVIFAILLTVLFNMGGNNDTLKGAIEEYLSTATRYKAEIQTLHKMTFFPTVGINISGVKLTHPQDTEKVISAESANIAIGFWNVILNNHRLKALSINNLELAAGVLTPHPIMIEELAIDENIDSEPFLKMDGSIGNTDFSGRLDLKPRGLGKSRSYTLGEDKQLQISLGDLDLRGLLRPRTMGGLHLKDFILSYDGQETLKGGASFARTSTSTLDINGDLTAPEYNTQAQIDWQVTFGTPRKIEGDINAQTFAIQDLLPNSRLRSARDAWYDILEGDNNTQNAPVFDGLAIDLELKAENFVIGGTLLGPLQTPIALKDSVLEIQPINGTISKGALNGAIIVNAQGDAINSDIKLDLNHFDYGYLQERIAAAPQIKGAADAKLVLNGETQSLDSWLQSLTGDLMVVGGEGNFKSEIVDLWGEGLISTIMSGSSTGYEVHMNCGVADFSIANAVASAQTLFIDTKTVTLTGEGIYDIGNNWFDMTLNPKPKEIAVGDVATEVSVTGPIQNPSFDPTALGIAKKIGGLLLGVINPALLAFSLTDLGLSEDHPCAPFIQGGEAEQPSNTPVQSKGEAE